MHTIKVAFKLKLCSSNDESGAVAVMNYDDKEIDYNDVFLGINMPEDINEKNLDSFCDKCREKLSELANGCNIELFESSDGELSLEVEKLDGTHYKARGFITQISSKDMDGCLDNGDSVKFFTKIGIRIHMSSKFIAEHGELISKLENKGKNIYKC